MKKKVTGLLSRGQDTFGSFTLGQKVVAIIGSLALLLGGFMVFNWASSPSYAPVYTNLASADASAVVEQLEASGTPYKLAGDGTTVMVPRDQVYQARLDLSAEGVPSASRGGYSLLDDQGLTTSDFKERTDYKRAMEGELASTIEAIDGVETAVVHLAIPEKEVFSKEQDPTTASVLLKTRAGTEIESDQVQAVVNLVAASIDGLDPDKVTVADAQGTVLTSPGGVSGGDGSVRSKMIKSLQEEYRSKLQSMLDTVVGPNNSTVQVSAILDFDETVREQLTYQAEEDALPLSSKEVTETFRGTQDQGTTGVVGPDGQMDSTTTVNDGNGSYEKSEIVNDNAVGSTKERRETTPGALQKLSIGVVLDANKTGQVAYQDVEEMVVATAGIDTERGDTVSVSALPFDRSIEESAAAELEKAEKADADAARNEMIRNGAIAVLIVAFLALAWLAARRRAKRRLEETSYIVEQLRERQPQPVEVVASPAALALEEAEASHAEELRDELTDLIERQPDDVAALLRGWLGERS